MAFGRPNDSGFVRKVETFSFKLLGSGAFGQFFGVSFWYDPLTRLTLTGQQTRSFNQMSSGVPQKIDMLM